MAPEKTDAEKRFELRLSECFDEMKWLYFELYRDHSYAFQAFLEMLRRNAAEAQRWAEIFDPGERKPAEDFWRGEEAAVGMTVFPEAFGGTFRELAGRIPYLKECGVNLLRLLPFMESPAEQGDGGFAISDFRKVRPELGTKEELRAFAAACHRAGIRLCYDTMLNHTSSEHSWAARAKLGEAEYQDRYYFYDDWMLPNVYDQYVPQALPQLAPGNFTWCEEAGKVVMTTFRPFQWDLNYSNPAVLHAMTEHLLFLRSLGADVIALNGLSFLWKTLGTACRNLPQVHSLLRLFRLSVDLVSPGTRLLGDICAWPSAAAPFFGAGEKRECGLLQNSGFSDQVWNAVATGESALLGGFLERLFSLPGRGNFACFLRNHDEIGWNLNYEALRSLGLEEDSHRSYLNRWFTGNVPGSDARGRLSGVENQRQHAKLCGTTASLCGLEAARESGDRERADRALRLDITLHALLFTQSGIPFLYGGDEIGQLNVRGCREGGAGDDRCLHRGAMDWGRAERRRDASTPQGRLFAAVRRMAELRKRHRVFSADAELRLIDPGNPHMLCIERYFDGQRLLALFHFGDRPGRARIGGMAPYLDLFEGVERSPGEVELPARGFLWLLSEENGETGIEK